MHHHSTPSSILALLCAGASLALAQDAANDPPPAPKPPRPFIGVRELHGLILGAAFVFLLPTGAIAIRTGSRRGFMYHWVTQVVGTIVALMGIGVGLRMAWRDGFNLRKAHQVGGLLIGLVLVVQMGIGWWHHILYLRTRRKTTYGNAHVWIGRVACFCALLNLAVGLRLAHAKAGVLVLWYGSLIVEAGILGLIAVKSGLWQRVWYGREQVPTAEPDVVQDDEGVGLFRLDEEDEEDEEDEQAFKRGAEVSDGEVRKGLMNGESTDGKNGKDA